MKRRSNFLYSIIGIILLVGMGFIGCDNGNSPGSNEENGINPFKGIWKGSIVNGGETLKNRSITIIINDKTWQYTTDEAPIYGEKGTYAYISTTATMTVTHRTSNGTDNWESGYFSNETFEATLSGNKITVRGDSYTKQ